MAVQKLRQHGQALFEDDVAENASANEMIEIRLQLRADLTHLYHE